MPSRDELRDLAQQQNLNQYNQAQQDKSEIFESGESVTRIGRRDINTGKDEVIYLNGGTEIAGIRTFNASLPYASTVRSTSSTNLFRSLDSRSYVPTEVELEEPLRQKLYSLKVLVIATDANNNDKYIFYVGTERTPVKKVWEQPDPSHLLETEDDYYIRIDNTNPNKLDGWAITSMWYDARIAQPQNIFDTPVLARSLDAQNFYEVSGYSVHNMKVAGAYFLAQTCDDILRPHINNIHINGTVTRNFDYSVFQPLKIRTLNTSQSFSFGSERGGQLINSPPEVTGIPGATVLFYHTPATRTLLNSHTLDWFSASGYSSFNYLFTEEINQNQNGLNHNQSFAEVSGNLNYSATQKCQTIYKNIINCVNCETTESFQFSGNHHLDKTFINYLSGTTTESTPYTEASHQNRNVLSEAINVLPFDIDEIVYSYTSSYNLNESGKIINEYGFSAFGEIVKQPTLDYLGNILPFGSYIADMSRYTFRVPISAGGVLYRNVYYDYGSTYPLALVNNPNNLEQRVTNRFITQLVSSDGLEGIVNVQKNTDNNFYSRNIDGGLEYHYANTSVHYGRYYYNMVSGQVSKKIIEYSGYRYSVHGGDDGEFSINEIDNYATSYFPREPLPEGSSVFSVPENISVDTVLTFNSEPVEEFFGFYANPSYGFGPFKMFRPGSVVEYQFRDSAASLHYYGSATILSVSGNRTTPGHISFKIENIKSIPLNIAQSLELSLSTREQRSQFINGIIIQTPGHRVLRFIDDYGSSQGITLKNGYLYLVETPLHSGLWNNQDYYLCLGIYKIKDMPNGRLYLDRQEIKPIRCKAIGLDEQQNNIKIRTITFAYQ